MAARRCIILLAVLLGALTLATGPDAQASPRATGTASDPYRYSAKTGHTIQPPVTAAYDAAGGERILGLPLTEVFTDADGVRAQYFENARFELRRAPDGADQVARTLLGSLLTQGRSDEAFAPRDAADAAPASRFIPETRHTIGGAFRAFWERNGGVAAFGYPISEELVEEEQGAPQVAQWFERSRFVYRPDIGQVQLSPLGRIYADARGLPAERRAAVQPVVKLGEGRFAFSPSSAAGQNIRLALARLNGTQVAPGQVLRFNAAIGEVSARAGYKSGGMIVGGVVTEGVGGGICQVSSALYVAALRAGLAIEARQGHSLLLRFAEAAPGMEAAVAQPDLDLAIRNDTPYPLAVVAYDAGGTLIVSLWGRSDGRTTKIGAPAIGNVQTVPDSWVFDATLASGAIKRVSQGNEGMDVRVSREVRAADGRVLSRSVARTHYAPWPAVYRYGPDVTPPGATPTSAPAAATPEAAPATAP